MEGRNDVMKIIDIFKANDEKKLVLPDFQRDFEWKESDQKRLLSSVLVSLPIGSLLLLQGEKDDFAAKELCFPRKQIQPKDECSYLLDGQQRISSLKSIFSDFFLESANWKEIFDHLYRNLRLRWFLRVKPLNDEEDLFGWRNLRFKGNKYEPEQIIDFIECKRIYKTKTEQWYNPGYCPRDDKGDPLDINRKILKIAKHASDEYLVPLYTLYNPKSPYSYKLHERVIENIANERVSELKADVADGKKDIVELLEDIEPNINQLISKNDEEQLNFAWSKLSAKWSQNMINYLDGLLGQEIHIIELPSDEISRATSIFENINRGGTPLDVYDLIVAKAARDRSLPSLTQRIVETLEVDLQKQNMNALYDGIISPVPDKWNVKYMQTIDDNKPCRIIKNQYLNLLSIFCHCKYGDVEAITGEHIRKNKQLELNDKQINQNTDTVIEALKRACAFLQFRCGIVYINELPYELMILPVTYALRDDEIWANKSSIAKIEYWYWCSLFGGAYRERQNERCIRDIKNLYKWLKGGENKFKSFEDSLLNAIGYSDLNTLLLKDDEHPVTSAIRNGILQYILSKQPKDFLPSYELRLNTWDIAVKKDFVYKGKTYPLEIVDHHIYPLGGATTIGESSREIRSDNRHILNSPLNRTYITSVANKVIRDKSPKEYLQYISEYAHGDHYITTEFFVDPIATTSAQDQNQKQQEQYEYILTSRYKEIKYNIKRELEYLLKI